MQHYLISDKRAQTLEKIAKSTDFKNSDRVLRFLIDRYANNLIQKDIISYDVKNLQLADNENLKTQNQWIDYFNDSGKTGISSAKIYHLAKTASDEILNTLKDKFYSYAGVIANTRILYSTDSLSGKITHDYGSIITENSCGIIPYYDGVPIDEVMATEEGLQYIHALFHTKDPPHSIKKNIKNILYRDSDEIYIWTPTLDSKENLTRDSQARSVVSERAVIFDGSITVCKNSYFSIGASTPINMGRYVTFEASK